MKLIELLKEDATSIHSIWYNPETTGSVAIDRFAYHDRLIHQNPEFFPNKPEDSAKALEQGYLRGAYASTNRGLTIDAKDTNHVAEFIKWIRQNYGRINRVHIFVPQNASSLTGDQIDNVIMTGKLPVHIGEALNNRESYNIWYNPQTDEALIKTMVQSTHLFLIQENLDWFGISHKDKQDIIRQWGQFDASDYYRLAFDNGYIRGYYAEGTIGIETVSADDVPPFIKWLKTTFKKLNFIDVDFVYDRHKEYRLDDVDIDQVLMTGRLPVIRESLKENYNINLDSITNQILQTNQFSNHGSSLGEFIYHYPDSYKPWWDESLSELQILHSPEFKEGFKRWMKDRYRYVIRQLKEDIKGFPLEVARAMTVPLGARPKPGDAVGLFWAVHSRNYEVMAYQGKGGEEIFMAASVGKDDINWKETIRSRMDYMHGDGEGEIQLKPGRVVNIHTGDIEPGQYVTKNLGESRRRIAKSRSIDNLFEAVTYKNYTIWWDANSDDRLVEPWGSMHHLDFVEEEPDRFGLKDISEWDGQNLIRQVKKNGWVRANYTVRDHGLYIESYYPAVIPEFIQWAKKEFGRIDNAVVELPTDSFRLSGDQIDQILMTGKLTESIMLEVSSITSIWYNPNTKKTVSEPGHANHEGLIQKNPDFFPELDVVQGKYDHTRMALHNGYIRGIYSKRNRSLAIEASNTDHVVEFVKWIKQQFGQINGMSVETPYSDDRYGSVEVDNMLMTGKLTEEIDFTLHSIWYDPESNTAVYRNGYAVHNIMLRQQATFFTRIKVEPGAEYRTTVEALAADYIRGIYDSEDGHLSIHVKNPDYVPAFMRWAKEKYRKLNEVEIDFFKSNKDMRLSADQIDRTLMTGKLTEATKNKRTEFRLGLVNFLKETYEYNEIREALQNSSAMWYNINTKQVHPEYEWTDSGSTHAQAAIDDFNIPELQGYEKRGPDDPFVLHAALEQGWIRIVAFEDATFVVIMQGLNEQAAKTAWSHFKPYAPENTQFTLVGYDDGYEEKLTESITEAPIMQNPDPSDPEHGKGEWGGPGKFHYEDFKDATLLGRMHELYVYYLPNERGDSDWGSVHVVLHPDPYQTPDNIQDVIEIAGKDVGTHFEISTTIAAEQYTGFDIGAKLYEFLVLNWKPLMSDTDLSGGGQHIWKQLAQNPKIKVFAHGLHLGKWETAFWPVWVENGELKSEVDFDAPDIPFVAISATMAESITNSRRRSNSIDKIFEDVVGMQAIWYNANTNQGIMEPWAYDNTHLNIIQNNPDFFGESKEVWKKYGIMNQILKHYFQQGFVRGAYSDKRKFLSVHAKEEADAAGLIKWVSQSIRKIDTIAIETDYAEYKLSGNDIDDVIMTGTIPRNKAKYARTEPITNENLSEAKKNQQIFWYNPITNEAIIKPYPGSYHTELISDNLSWFDINPDDIDKRAVSGGLYELAFRNGFVRGWYASGIVGIQAANFGETPKAIKWIADNIGRIKEVGIDLSDDTETMSLTGDDVDQVLMTGKLSPDYLLEDTSRTLSLWYDPETKNAVYDTGYAMHHFVLVDNTEFFTRMTVDPDNPYQNTVDALGSNYIRGIYNGSEGYLSIQATKTDHIVEFIKWMKQQFRRLNGVDIDIWKQGRGNITSQRLSADEVDKTLMTGRLRVPVGEAREANLYHWIDGDKAVDIFQNDIMPAFWTHNIRTNIGMAGTTPIDGTSMTRNPYFRWIYGDRPFRLVFDEWKLAQTNKIIPLDADAALSLAQQDRSAEKGKSPHKQMAEEFVVGDVKPLHKYLIRIEVNPHASEHDMYIVKDFIEPFAEEFDIPLISSPAIHPTTASHPRYLSKQTTVTGESLNEDVDWKDVRILYHASHTGNLDSIRDFGVIPMHGEIVQTTEVHQTYEEWKEELTELSFFSPNDIGFINWQVGNKIGKNMHDVTVEDIREHGLLTILYPWKHTDEIWCSNADGTATNLEGEKTYDVPGHVEGVDCFSFEVVQPDVILVGDKLIDYIEKVQPGILAWAQGKGPTADPSEYTPEPIDPKKYGQMELPLVKEAKQVGPLYHYTTLSQAEEILNDGYLIGKHNKKLKVDFETISFTRNQNYHTTVEYMPTGGQIRLTLDGDKISNNYKVQPIVGGAASYDHNLRFSTGIGNNETETIVFADKLPIKEFLTAVDVNTKDLGSYGREETVGNFARFVNRNYGISIGEIERNRKASYVDIYGNVSSADSNLRRMDVDVTGLAESQLMLKGTNSNIAIWYDPQTAQTVNGPWMDGHDSVIAREFEFFARIEDQLTDAEFAGEWVTETAVKNGFVRVVWGPNKRSLDIETNNVATIPEVIKWIYQNYGRINIVYITDQTGISSGRLEGEDIDQVLMTGKYPLNKRPKRTITGAPYPQNEHSEFSSIDAIFEAVTNNKTIWWDSNSDDYIIKPWGIEHADIIRSNLDRFGLDKESIPVYKDIAGNMDTVQMAIERGWVRAHYAVRRRSLYIETKYPQVVPNFIKWAKSLFKRIDTVDLEVGENGYLFQEEEVDQILMTGKLPPMTESLNEIEGISSSTSIEFTCGACMYFAYVLNRKFGWSMAGTFVESPIDPEKGQPGEVSDFTDYDTEKVMFGHVWVQPTSDIAVDIDGAKSTNKMKEQWSKYPYTHVTSISPEWMGEFFKKNYPNAQARRSVWKRALKAANLLRPHLKGEGLAESITNERSEFKIAQKIPRVNLVSFLKTIKEDEEDDDPWANEEGEWVEIGFMNAQNGLQIRHRTYNFDLPPHSSLIIKQPATFGLDQQYLARVLGSDSWQELWATHMRDNHGDSDQAERAINNELEHVLNGLYGLVYHNGWIRDVGDGDQLQMTSSDETLRLAWSTGAMQRLIRDIGSEVVQISDMYSGVLRYESGRTFLETFDLTNGKHSNVTSLGSKELEAYLS